MLGSDLLSPSSNGYNIYLKAWIFFSCTLLTLFLLLQNNQETQCRCYELQRCWGSASSQIWWLFLLVAEELPFAMAGKHSFLQRSYRMISAPGQLSRRGTGCKRMGSHIKQPPCATSHKDLVSPHPFPPTGSAFLLCPTLHTLQRPRNQKASDLRISPPHINDYSTMKRTSTSDLLIQSFYFKKSILPNLF